MLGFLRRSLSLSSHSTLEDEEEKGLVNMTEKRTLMAQDADRASYLPLYTSHPPPPTYSKAEDTEVEEESRQDRTLSIVNSIFGWLTILCMLGIFFQLGNKTGLLPPNGGTAVDMRVVWNVEPVPQSARDEGLVPWWKLVMVTLKVDVDIIAGEGQFMMPVAGLAVTNTEDRPFTSVLQEAHIASAVDSLQAVQLRVFAAADRS